jgi:hypothetical protein
MGFLFYRNTHEGPNFLKFRAELELELAGAVFVGETAAGRFEEKDLRLFVGEDVKPTLLIHLLGHGLGKTMDQVWEEVQAYNKQHPGEPFELDVEGFLQEFLDGMEDTVIVAREEGEKEPTSNTG